MKLPGEAWLEWRIAEAAGITTITQRAIFVPRGLLGRIYWYAVLPFHGVIFAKLAQAIADRGHVTPLVSEP